MINLFIVDYFDFFKNNGLNTYIVQLSRQLEHTDKVNVHYVLINSYKKYKELNAEEDICNQLTIYIPHEIGTNSNKYEYETNAVDFIKHHIRQKENIIFHFNWINHCPFADLLKDKINCKALLTKHCIPWREFINTDYPLYITLNRKFLLPRKADYLHPALIKEAIAYNAMDHIICVSHFARNALDKMLQFPRAKTTVIYNGFEYKKKRHVSQVELKKQYGFATHEKVMLFAGAVTGRKGIFDLIPVVEKIVDNGIPIRLVIAGGGEHSKALEKIKKQWARITITGNLDKPTLYQFYQMADIGIVPSYWEQCSYTVIEMMQHGLPVIVANVDGLAEMVPDDCGLKVPLVLGKAKAYIHQQKLADSILYFLNNPVIAKEYAARAKQHALKNFTAKKMVAETVKVYEKLIADANAPGQELAPINDGPLVSVLLPVYNGDKYLEECIGSILKQTYQNFELVIVDDGSTDKTQSIIKSFKDYRLVYINNPENRGIVYSLNTGVKTAKGKYIARIDADDMMHSERLQKQVAFLEESKHSDIAMTGSHHYVINASGQLVSLKQYPISDAEIKGAINFRNPFFSSSVMIRSGILKKHKYREKYPHYGDYDLWIRLSKNYSFANIPEYLTYYRIHEKNVLTQHTKIQQDNAAEIIVSGLDTLKIRYTADELKTHIAISFGYGVKYFNTPQKTAALNGWINKLLNTQKDKYSMPGSVISLVKEYILEQIVGVKDFPLIKK